MQNQKLGYRTLTECVMDYLKDQLNQDVLKPGDEIHITELSETLGVSRTPIREALIQLVKEGFVDLESRKMFRIRKLTLKEIKYMYQIIGLLEAAAAGFAWFRWLRPNWLTGLDWFVLLKGGRRCGLAGRGPIRRIAQGSGQHIGLGRSGFFRLRRRTNTIRLRCRDCWR